MIRAKIGENRPDACVCLADQFERFGHRDYCDEQTQISEFENMGE